MPDEAVSSPLSPATPAAGSVALCRGVFAAALTPLRPDRAPNLAAYLRHARWLLDRGCDGLGVLGTTGEANSLTVEQRLGLIEAVAEALPPDRLLVGTGSCSLGDAVRLTRACLDAGLRHVLMLPPFYYKPVDEDGLFGFFAAVIEAAGDPELRLFLYNFPRLTGVPLSLALYARLRRAYGPVIAGTKDSSGVWPDIERTCRELPDFVTFAGTESYLLATLRAGGAGCISATANLTAPLCRAVYRAWHTGDQARADALQNRLTTVRQALEGAPTIAALKALMRQRTGEAVWDTILPPLLPLGAEQASALAGRLDELGGVDSEG